MENKVKIYIAVALRIASFAWKPALTILTSVVICTMLAGRISSISASVKEKQTLNIALQNRLEAISKIDEALKKVGDANYAKVDNALVATDNITDVVTALDDLASKNSIRETPSLGGITPESYEIAGGTKVGSLTFTISTNASVSTLINFLKGLESMQFLPVVQGVDLNSSSAGRGWNVSSGVSVRGKIYVKQS